MESAEKPLEEENAEKMADENVNAEGLLEGMKPDVEFKDDTEKAKMKIVTTTIRDTRWRFIFLAVCCFVLMGSYYCYDNPAPVQKELQAPIKHGTDKGVEHGMALSNFQYQLLYSFYSLPNIIIPLFGGFFIDRLGKKNGILVFVSIVAAGQFLFCISTHVISSSEGFGKFLAIFGRFVFGLGGENLSVTESAFLASWFKGKEMSFAMGTDLCVSRIFTVINDVTQPAFYTATGYKLSFGFWFGFMLCVISIGCAAILVQIDNKADLSSVQLELPISEAETIDNEDKEEEEYEDQVSLRDLRSLGKVFWALTGSCVMTYMSFMSCMNVSSSLLQKRFGLSLESAAVVMSLPYLIAAVITPFMGYLLDLYGMKTITMTCSSSLFALSHLYLALLGQHWPGNEPSYRCVFAFVMFGICYSFYTTSIWPCVPYVVEKKMLGSAYGILVSVESMGFTLGPLLVSAMSSTTYKEGYFAVSLLNFFEALIGAGFAGYILYYDVTHSRVLISNSKRAVAIQKAEHAKRKAEVKAVQAPVITGL